MKIKLHARNIDSKLRIALYAMTEFALSKLVPSERLRNNLTINIHLKHHEEDAEAMLDEFANPYRPREFKIIIDHHRILEDNYGRERHLAEWCHEILKTLAHELVHVKQYLLGELTWRNKGMFWKGKHCLVETLEEYYESAYEIEAYGREKGILVSFLIRWKEIEKEMGMKCSLI